MGAGALADQSNPAYSRDDWQPYNSCHGRFPEADWAKGTHVLPVDSANLETLLLEGCYLEWRRVGQNVCFVQGKV